MKYVSLKFASRIDDRELLVSAKVHGFPTMIMKGHHSTSMFLYKAADIIKTKYGYADKRHVVILSAINIIARVKAVNDLIKYAI